MWYDMYCVYWNNRVYVEKGASCKCWSTCSPFESGRLCDHVNVGYDTYNKTDNGKNNVGCSYIPGVR